MLDQLLENLSNIRDHSTYISRLLNSRKIITCQLLKDNYTRIIKGKSQRSQNGVIYQITDVGTSISDEISYHDYFLDEREIEHSGEDDWR